MKLLTTTLSKPDEEILHNCIKTTHTFTFTIPQRVLVHTQFVIVAMATKTHSLYHSKRRISPPHMNLKAGLEAILYTH